MGAYLYFRLAAPEKTEEANEWLANQPENDELGEYEYGQKILFWSIVDKAIEERKIKQKGHGVPDFHDIGETQLKTSCLPPDYAEEVKSQWVELFDRLHDRFDIEVYSGSCSLRASHFSPAQLSIITDDGEALTGDEIETVEEHMNGKYPVV